MNLYVVFFVPVAMGVFASVFDLQNFLALKLGVRIAFGGFYVVCIIVIALLVFGDMKDPAKPVPAFFLAGGAAKEAGKKHEEATKCILEGEPSESCRILIEEYKDLAPSFSSLSDMRTRASGTVWISMFISCLNVSFVVLFIIYNIILLIVQERLTPGQYERMVCSGALLMLFFPLSLYTQWYWAFFSLDHLSRFPAALLLTLLAAVGLFILVFSHSPGVFTVAVATCSTLFGTVVGWLLKFKPDRMRPVAELIESIPNGGYVAIVLICVLLVGAVVLTFFRSELLVTLK